MKKNMHRLHVDITKSMKERIDSALENGHKISTSELIRSGIERELVKAGV